MKAKLNLLQTLIFRDITLRFKQTIGGFAWALIQPVMFMVVFSLFFGRVLKVDTLGIPYPVFSYTALLPWTLFTVGLQKASNSLVTDQILVTKMKFPIMLLPLSAVLSQLIDFLIAFLVLAAMMLYFHIGIGIAILACVYFLTICIVLAFGIGLWLSAINIEFRDVSYALPFIIQLALFISPVAYSSNMVSGGWFEYVYILNPMTGVLEGFRWAVLGVSPHPVAFLSSTVIAIVVLITGIKFFQIRQPRFADIV
jgi:lipopolysaccharide transport system permease protein